MKITRTAGFICLLWVAGCAAPPTSTPTETAGDRRESSLTELQATQTKYAELAKSGGRVANLDPQRSSVRIYVFRTGAAARLGHNHVLAAPKFSGYVYLPPAGTAAAQFDLEFRLDELEIDNPAHRTALGSAFSSTPSATDIAGTRTNMLGEKYMQADRFPFVRIHSLRVVGEAPKLAAEVQVEMHGQKRELRVPLTVDGLPDHLKVTGAFTLRQTDFGVQPLSIFNGLIAVADEVIIEFSLAEAANGTKP